MFSTKIKKVILFRIAAVCIAIYLLIALISGPKEYDIDSGPGRDISVKERDLKEIQRHRRLERRASQLKDLSLHDRAHLEDDEDESFHLNLSPAVRNTRNSRFQRQISAHFFEPQMGSMRRPLITDRVTTMQTWNWGQNIERECSKKKYNLKELASTSVIITFHENEKLSHLIRTLHSIIERTPPSLLEEIILINDNSHKEDHEVILQNYITSVFNTTKIRLLFGHDGLGLIRARLSGIRLANGEVIVSMDSHMEVQKGWLPPLLDAIRENPRTLAASFLDWMSKEKGVWSYRHGPSTWKTYFDWSLVFGFQDSTRKEINARADVTAPIRSPVTIGTIWAMKRDVFEDIGAFDEQMEGWGGENLDLPIRLWLCGGQVVNVPCSHAGHLEEDGHRDYRKSWTSQINRNYKRVVEVWFDRYKEYFYHEHPEVKKVGQGDLSSRFAIKEKCLRLYGHDFDWYLKNVFPELGLPGGPTSLAWDGVKNLAFNTCLGMPEVYTPGLTTCSDKISTQKFFWDIEGHLRHPVHIFNGRNISGKPLNILEYISSHDMNRLSKWIHWQNGWIMLYPHNLCLQATAVIQLDMKMCDVNDIRQRWTFQKYTSLYSTLVNAVLEKEPDGKFKGNNKTIRAVFSNAKDISSDYIQSLTKTIQSANFLQTKNGTKAS